MLANDLPKIYTTARDFSVEYQLPKLPWVVTDFNKWWFGCYGLESEMKTVCLKQILTLISFHKLYNVNIQQTSKVASFSYPEEVGFEAQSHPLAICDANGKLDQEQLKRLVSTLYKLIFTYFEDATRNLR